MHGDAVLDATKCAGQGTEPQHEQPQLAGALVGKERNRDAAVEATSGRIGLSRRDLGPPPDFPLKLSLIHI